MHKKYQIKHRSPNTLNVDLNNFSFDFVVLVNVDDNYGVTGIWRMDQETAKRVFVHRPAYRKYQATQTAFKSAAPVKTRTMWRFQSNIALSAALAAEMN